MIYVAGRYARRVRTLRWHVRRITNRHRPPHVITPCTSCRYVCKSDVFFTTSLYVTQLKQNNVISMGRLWDPSTVHLGQCHHTKEIRVPSFQWPTLFWNIRSVKEHHKCPHDMTPVTTSTTLSLCFCFKPQSPVLCLGFLCCVTQGTSMASFSIITFLFIEFF